LYRFFLKNHRVQEFNLLGNACSRHGTVGRPHFLCSYKPAPDVFPLAGAVSRTSEAALHPIPDSARLPHFPSYHFVALSVVLLRLPGHLQGAVFEPIHLNGEGNPGQSCIVPESVPRRLGD
jgi:hypothetical protein